MTDEEWKAAEAKMSDLYGLYKLKADGYILTLAWCPQTKKSMKFEILVYVNGNVKGEWLTTDCEIRRKFYRERKRCMLTAKEKASIPKRYLKQAKEKYTCSYYYPAFASFNQLKAHLLKTCQSIEPYTEEETKNE